MDFSLYSSNCIKKYLTLTGYLIITLFFFWAKDRLGFSGMGYFGTLFLFASLFAQLFLYDNDEEYARLLKSRISRGLLGSVRMVSRYGAFSILIFSVLGGGLFGLFGYCFLVKSLRMSHITSLPVCCILLFLLIGIKQVFTGALIGYGKNILIGIMKLVASVLFCGFAVLFIFIEAKQGQLIGDLLGGSDYSSVYIVFGMLLAYGVTLVLMNIILGLLYFYNKRIFPNESLKNNGSRDTLFSVWTSMLVSRIPRILVTLCVLIPVSVFLYLSGSKQESGISYAFELGKIVSGVGIILVFAFLLLYFSLYLLIHYCDGAFRKDSKRNARFLFQVALHFSVIIGGLICSFLFISSSVLSSLFFMEQAQVYKGLFLKAGILVLPLGLIVFLFELIYRRGITEYLSIVAAITACLSTISFFALYKSDATNVSNILTVFIIAAYVLLIGLFYLAVRYLDMNIDPINSFAIPLVVTTCCALIVWVLYLILTPHLGGLFVVIMGLLILSMLLFTTLILISNISENEIHYIPYGIVLHFIGNVFHRF